MFFWLINVLRYANGTIGKTYSILKRDFAADTENVSTWNW